MRVILRLAAVLSAVYIIFAGVVAAQEVYGDPMAELLAANPGISVIGGGPDILPMNPPEVQTKSIHAPTAEERSTILISDIWKPPELERVKIGQGGRLGAAKSDTPVGPYGWQAFVSQDAIGSWRGGAEAMAYGGL